MRAPLAAILALTAACGAGLDAYGELADLRVLAIRAEPPEIAFEALGPLDVTFDALVVDPRSDGGVFGSVEYAWSLCPVETNNACADFGERRDRASAEVQPALDAMRAVGASGVAAYQPDAEGLTQEQRDERALWPYAVPSFSVSLDADTTTSLLRHHLETSLLGLGAGAWPSAILEVHKSGGASEVDRVLAQKRFVVSARDIGGAAALLGADLGFTVCPEGESPATVPGCVALRPRVANTNPVFAAVQIAEGELATTPFVDWEGPYVMGPGAKIRLLPVFTPESFEPYQELETDLETQRITAVDRVEEISVSWFVSGGELQDELTWPKFTKTLDTVFTAPDAPGRASIIMVARDQRGGTAWRTFEIVVRP